MNIKRSRTIIMIFFTLTAAFILIGCGGKKPKTVDGISYIARNDYSHLVKCDPTCENPVILDKFEDEWVREIMSDAFTECIMTQITIPDWIEVVRSGAFTDCPNLKTVTIEGKASFASGAFRRCNALESVVYPNGTLSISMDAFEDCTALKEICVPASCTEIQGDIPKGVTMVINTVEMAETALKNGWDFRMGNDSEVMRMTLAEAVQSEKVRLEIEGTDPAKFLIRNISKDLLILEGLYEYELTSEDKTFYVAPAVNQDLDEPMPDRSLVLGPEDQIDLFADYYAAYGPGESTIQIAAESQYIAVRIYAGRNKKIDEFTVSPFERKTSNLPCGRYKLIFQAGETAEDANQKKAGAQHLISKKDFEADSFYEISRCLNGNGYNVFQMKEYGPGTSSLYLRAEEKSACYRLVRIGGEVEQEVFLESHTSKKISFPCGWYRLRIAEGETWISKEEAFGTEGKYSAIDYFNYKDGESYKITTTVGTGNVNKDSSGGFGH